MDSVRRQILSHRLIRLAIVLAAGGATLGLHWFLSARGLEILSPHWRGFYFSLLVAAVLVFIPSSHRRRWQTCGLAAAFLVNGFDPTTKLLTTFNLGVPLALIFSLRWLPLNQRKFYRAAIFSGVAIIAGYSLFIIKYWGGERSDITHSLFLVSNAFACFFITAAALKERELLPTWSNLVRPMTVAYNGLGPMPVREAVRDDFSLKLQISGALWVFAALALFLVSRMLSTFPNLPVGSLISRNYFLSIEMAALLWVERMSWIMSSFALVIGAARLIGVPVSYPVLQPWIATDFADYWKRANFARYEMFQKVFWNAFGTRISAAGMASRVFGVFFVSAILNLHRSATPLHFLRWYLEALFTIVSLLALRAIAFKRIRRFVKLRQPPKALSPWIGIPLRVALSLVVIISHGFLYGLDDY